MTRHLNEMQLGELNREKEWCLTILEFAIARSRYGRSEFQWWVDQVMDAATGEDLEMLRSHCLAISDWAPSLPERDVHDLNALLKDRFGEDLADSMGRRAKRRRRPSETQLQELEHKKDWCLAIEESKMAREGPSPWTDWSIHIIKRTYLDRDLRGMRQIARDLNEEARYLPKKDLDRLNAVLKEKFGEDLSENRKKDLVKIDRIRKRGRIRSENEFRLVKERTEEIWQDDDKEEENEALNKLLTEFEFGVVKDKPERKQRAKFDFKQVELVRVAAPDNKKEFSISEGFVNGEYDDTSGLMEWDGGGNGIFRFRKPNSSITAHWRDSSTLVVVHDRDIEFTQREEKFFFYGDKGTIEYVPVDEP
jgi:hypothetical protein